MATNSEIEALKRKLQKLNAAESAVHPNWVALAKKSNKGLKKSQSGKKKRDALSKRLPGAGWTKNG